MRKAFPVGDRYLTLLDERRPSMKKLITFLLILLVIFALSGCCMPHEWEAATCTEPKTCLKCGKTNGKPLGHDWAEATCTEPQTCSRCGETEGKPLGHTWVPATSTEPKTCSVCGETEGEPAPALALAEYYASLSEEERSQLIALQSNMNNDGLILYHDGWVYTHYFPGQANRNSLAKSRLDGSEQTVLMDKTIAGYLTVNGNHLYFCTLWTQRTPGIYRVSLTDDTVELVKQIKNILWMQLFDGKIYYTVRENRKLAAGPLYCCDMNGENAEKVLDKAVRFGFFTDRFFLYQDQQDGESMHLWIVGGEDYKLTNEVSYKPIFDGEYLYYDHRDSDGSQDYDSILCRARLDGTDYKEIKDFGEYLYCHAMYGDFLYYAVSDSYGSISKEDAVNQFTFEITAEKRCINDLYIIDDMLVYIIGTYTSSGFAPADTVFCDMNGNVLFQS